jgi:hypothetical protein
MVKIRTAVDLIVGSLGLGPNMLPIQGGGLQLTAETACIKIQICITAGFCIGLEPAGSQRQGLISVIDSTDLMGVRHKGMEGGIKGVVQCGGIGIRGTAPTG